jgi:putative ABC transport system permease protein
MPPVDARDLRRTGERARRDGAPGRHPGQPGVRDGARHRFLAPGARQLGGFIWTETAFVTVGGLLLGAAGASWPTWMLVRLLTGVFDPPPTVPAVPWTYLVVLAIISVMAVAAASASALRTRRGPVLEGVRDL